MSQTPHTHTRDSEPLPVGHRRASDATIARWARRFAYTLLAGLVPTAGVLWKERESKVQQLNLNIAGLERVKDRVTALEKRVDTNQIQTMDGQREIKEELQDTRKEIREMFRRAIEAGGRRP